VLQSAREGQVLLPGSTVPGQRLPLPVAPKAPCGTWADPLQNEFAVKTHDLDPCSELDPSCPCCNVIIAADFNYRVLLLFVLITAARASLSSQFGTI